MKTGIKPTWLILLLACTFGCTGKSGQVGKTSFPSRPAAIAGEPKIVKAVFYIENSESMFGYVSNITEYVEVIAELAEMPEFIKDRVPREFNFINGTDPVITPVRNDASVLKSKLNRAGFNCGDITKSNLNGMFQVALKNAGNGIISVLISDGLYDIGGAGVTSLVTEGRGTRSQFINRLMTGDLQTIIIKLRSRFDGKYFYSSRRGAATISGIRPYYIWIIGESRLLNRYFPNEYIPEKLKGYENMVRFVKPGTAGVPYQATADHSVGTFKFDREVINRLNDAKSDSHGQGFQFSIAVDYSGLPYPDSFLSSPENYRVSSNYTITGIQKPAGKVHSVAFNPTHLITVKTMKYPAGKLVVSLVSNIPGWVRTTGTVTEDHISQDSTHTYGFGYLINGIVEAYESVSENKSIAAFEIDIH